MSDTLIKVENVSKKFCRSLKRSLWYGMHDLSNELLGRHHNDGTLRKNEFWAIKKINFELKQGECLGLIGHNGAGKTTLLRMLNGLIKPDSGRIEMKGLVTALIALGAGFNPVLTGRQNIYVNGSVLGLSKKDIDQKLDAIIDFAEIESFIDTPLQSYSSGMTVRLGFSVAAILLKPDILILDEVLAVGDINFTIKCLNLIRELTLSSSVILVSHNMQYISMFCSRVIVLDHGDTMLDSLDVGKGIECYLGKITTKMDISGTNKAELLEFKVRTNGKTLDEKEPNIEQGAQITATLNFTLNDSINNAFIILQINDVTMSPLVSIPINDSTGHRLLLPPGHHKLLLPLGSFDFNAGKYSFVVIIRDKDSSIVLKRLQGISPFNIISPNTYWGKIVRPITPISISHNSN